jgi:hypothetical protein
MNLLKEQSYTTYHTTYLPSRGDAMSFAMVRRRCPRSPRSAFIKLQTQESHCGAAGLFPTPWAHSVFPALAVEYGIGGCQCGERGCRARLAKVACALATEQIVSPKQNGRLRVTLLFPEPGRRRLATAPLATHPCLNKSLAAA